MNDLLEDIIVGAVIGLVAAAVWLALIGHPLI